jgi:hypothetical protein
MDQAPRRSNWTLNALAESALRTMMAGSEFVYRVYVHPFAPIRTVIPFPRPSVYFGPNRQATALLGSRGRFRSGASNSLTQRPFLICITKGNICQRFFH